MNPLHFLPTDLLKIISQFKTEIDHSIKNEVVLNEMKNKKYHCSMCYDLCHEHMRPIFKNCDCCKEPICIDCDESFTDGNDGDECDDCFFYGMIYCNVISIINRKITDKEHDIIHELLFDIMVYDKEELCDFLYENFEFIIHNDKASMTFPVIYCILVEYIGENFD